MVRKRNQKIELLNFLRTGKPPKHFHNHAIGSGNLQEYCVFCKSPVDPSVANVAGYKIALQGPIPQAVDRNTVEFVEGELECTICIDCSNEVMDSEDTPTDTIDNLERFLETGFYPHNIIEFSLSESATRYCGFCRVDLDVYDFENCEAHTIPVGYHRNALEKQAIPGTIFLCPECRDNLRICKNNGHFTGAIKYTIDVCCDCCENTIITQSEYEHRIEHPGNYLCHDCARERGLQGLPRNITKRCADCGADGERMDILIEENSLDVSRTYRCRNCNHRDPSEVIRTYVGARLCIEVHTTEENEWTYVIFIVNGYSEEHDEVLHSSSKTWKESWKATFVGTIKAIEISKHQLELPFDE